ncbi:5b167baf-9e21-4560-af0f-6a3f10846933 [Thermothielavioides terrestris]|uniref:5b167baf-9e21-4560-af0f-6a3f10846933 n=1 Tax=Thermothielavioides terrestris TaxID=2587410 RepID=A0A3S4EWJ7_9PEZI|nr:5b167baf-9e21-4560-af0f-6a3f10846933 [Thermothielavioides terrestris]
MVLQLHVWGPAFGLPSLDAECLAAIAYLAQTADPADYQLIQSSPSAVPTHPPPPTFRDPSASTAAAAAADSTAYTAFLTAHAAPLLALSLYVSSANYAAATRPAYSAVLPLPLPWTEPPAARAAMARRAAHLGVSDALDADAHADAHGVRRVAEDGGWVTVPAALGGGSRKKRVGGVQGMLRAEQKARIRLEGLAEEVLDVLGEVEWEGKGCGIRCLVFGYLALMVMPEVPRPWLREVTQARYQGLWEFVVGFKREVFPEGRTLPWAQEKAACSAVAVGMRFVRGVLGEVPLVGELWSRWWTARKMSQVLGGQGTQTRSGGDLLLLLGAGLGLAAVSAGAFFYRSLPPFGEAVQVWRKPVVTLSSLGAAGALFSGAFYGVD